MQVIKQLFDGLFNIYTKIINNLRLFIYDNLKNQDKLNDLSDSITKIEESIKKIEEFLEYKEHIF